MRRLLLATLALAVLPAGAAEAAKLPSPKSKLIVPNKSIAGVSIGMNPEKAKDVWGPGSFCGTGSCVWSGDKGTARIDFTGAKVTAIHIGAGQKPSGEYFYKGPLVKWKTSKKVGLGTTINKVAKKYKKAKPNGGGLQLDGKKVSTFFSSSGGRVGTIDIAPR
jgi:hypothetical protein